MVISSYGIAKNKNSHKLSSTTKLQRGDRTEHQRKNAFVASEAICLEEEVRPLKEEKSGG